MRIAVLEPYIEGIGGAQKVIAQYSQYLKSKGHDVEIFTQRHNPSTAYSEFKGLKINLIKPKNKWLVPLTFLIKSFSDFDLVIANDWPTHFSSFRNNNVVWICYSPKRDFYDLKSFYCEQGGIKKKISILLKELFFKRIDKFCAKKCKIVLPISENIRWRLRDYYRINTSDIFYAGIDFSDFKSGSMQNYFLSVGRLFPTKRTELIVSAMDYVKNKNIKLIVLGSGPDMEKLKGISNKKVILRGTVSDSDKIKLYSNACALVCVPVSEDWGLTPIEAAASKIPTIGVNEGGLRETIVDNKTGFLLNNPTPKNIAAKMDYLINNKSRARVMGINAYKFCKKFDWENILPKFEKVLRSLQK